jgi:hypothetical protein
MWSGASVLLREDLGSILHPNPEWHFSEALNSLFQTTEFKQLDYVIKHETRKTYSDPYVTIIRD